MDHWTEKKAKHNKPFKGIITNIGNFWGGKTGIKKLKIKLSGRLCSNEKGLNYLKLDDFILTSGWFW